MLPTAIVERQAKLGVSAEDSKAQRLKRLQARFRDRGGVFVPSNSNPLVDILLARAVSGESPPKARPKNAPGKRLSSPKVRQASPTHTSGPTTIIEESAGSSKPKPPMSRKRKGVEPEADATTTSAPKRRSKPAKSKRKASGSDTEQHPLDTKSKSTSKGKGRPRNAAPSTSDGNPKMKTKPQAKVKPSHPKEVVEVLVSDDDQTLVDVPHKTKTNPKRNTRHDDDDETDDDVPIARKRATARVDDFKSSSSKGATHVNTERIASAKSSRKKTLEDGEEKSRGGKHPKTKAKKRLVVHDEEDDDNDVTSSPVKKGKVVSSTSAKTRTAAEHTPRTTEEKPKAKGKVKRNGGAEPDQDIVKSVEEDDKRLSERVSKPNKRKKEEDKYDDRPRKVVKFSDIGPSHSSSQKLKENQSNKKHKSATKSILKDRPNVPSLKLIAEPPSRTKISKGPPREVLERIKASAVRHLRCADSEPDELDCLS